MGVCYVPFVFLCKISQKQGEHKGGTTPLSRLLGRSWGFGTNKVFVDVLSNVNVSSVANLFYLQLILLTSLPKVLIVWQLQIWGDVCSNHESGGEGDRQQ